MRPVKLTDKGCTGAADWIVEIVFPGNSSHDYVRKLNLYLDAGVREYWIVNPMAQTVFVYNLEKDNFRATSCAFQDKIKVNIYNDLRGMKFSPGQPEPLIKLMTSVITIVAGSISFSA